MILYGFTPPGRKKRRTGYVPLMRLQRLAAPRQPPSSSYDGVATFNGGASTLSSVPAGRSGRRRATRDGPGCRKNAAWLPVGGILQWNEGASQPSSAIALSSLHAIAYNSSQHPLDFRRIQCGVETCHAMTHAIHTWTWSTNVVRSGGRLGTGAGAASQAHAFIVSVCGRHLCARSLAAWPLTPLRTPECCPGPRLPRVAAR